MKHVFKYSKLKHKYTSIFQSCDVESGLLFEFGSAHWSPPLSFLYHHKQNAVTTFSSLFF